MAVELCRANADADIIAFPAHFLKGASARGGGSRGTCTTHLESLAKLGLRSAIVVSCVDSDGIPFASVIQGGASIITVAAATGADSGPRALEAALWDPRGSIATVNTSAGPVQLGLLSGAATMDHAMAPRSLMLAGAELLINPVEQSAELTERDDDVLLTRGFENAAATARVSARRSALANWCNDMVKDGCPVGQTLIALADGGTTGAVRTSFSLTDLRAQRSNCIWGDAFRRPFQYQEIW